MVYSNGRRTWKIDIPGAPAMLAGADSRRGRASVTSESHRGSRSLSLVNISAPIAQPQTKNMCTVTSGSR